MNGCLVLFEVHKLNADGEYDLVREEVGESICSGVCVTCSQSTNGKSTCSHPCQERRETSRYVVPHGGRRNKNKVGTRASHDGQLGRRTPISLVLSPSLSQSCSRPFSFSFSCSR